MTCYKSELKSSTPSSGVYIYIPGS